MRQSYGWRDCVLYGLGLGFGLDPMAEPLLRYVFERDLRVFPTMANVLADPGLWLRDLDAGVDWRNVLLGEHALTLHASLMTEDIVLGRSRIVHIADKGPGRGALIYVERVVTSVASGNTIATLLQTLFCPGEGGFGGEPRPYRTYGPVPSRSPDVRIDIETSPQAALIYRLSGDLHPLHADPEVARAAGFARPILHGLATHGIAGAAVVRAFCGDDASRLTHLEARFSAPVYPGETIAVDLWAEGNGLGRFCARVEERNATVLTSGTARYRS